MTYKVELFEEFPKPIMTSTKQQIRIRSLKKISTSLKTFCVLSLTIIIAEKQKTLLELKNQKSKRKSQKSLALINCQKFQKLIKNKS